MASTKLKSTRKKCEHDKYKYLCSLCGGSGLCEHRMRKIFCKECDGVHIFSIEYTVGIQKYTN